MQNQILKYRGRKLFYVRETRLFVRKIENLDEFQLPYCRIFFAEFLHAFPSYQCLQKGVRNFFLFCLDLELLINLVFVSVQKTDLFLFEQITQVLNNIKKSHTIFCKHW